MGNPSSGHEPGGTHGLEVDTDRTSGVTTVHLRGDLDLESTNLLWRQLDDFEPTPTVVLDFSALGFIDSSGLNYLYRLRQRVADAGGMVVVTGASPPHRRLLETAGLSRLVAVLPPD